MYFNTKNILYIIFSATSQNRTPGSARKRKNFLTREVLYDTSQVGELFKIN